MNIKLGIEISRMACKIILIINSFLHPLLEKKLLKNKYIEQKVNLKLSC